MRTTRILFALAAAACLAQPVIADDDGGGQVFKVFPSTATDPLTKAQQDWNEINNALQNAGPGDTVRLAAGLFYLHKTISRRDFDGTLRGAGKNRTTVQTAPGIPFDLTSNLTYTFVDGFSFRDHFMFSFPHQLNNEERTVTVSDMKFVCNQPSTPWSRGQAGGLETNLNAVSTVLVFSESLPKEDLIDLSVNYLRLDIEGVEDPSFRSPGGTNYSCTSGVAALGVARGHVLVKKIDVRNALDGAVLHGWVGEGSSITVTNSVFENTRRAMYSDGWANYVGTRNRIINSKRIGVFLRNDPTYIPTGFTNTSGLVSKNTFSGGSVFDIILALSENVSVHKNMFNGLTTVGAAAGGAGLTASILTVFGSNSTISDNTFTNIGGGAGPDIRLAFSDGVSVQGNDHEDSGQPGWTGDPLNGNCVNGPGAIRVQGGNDNLLADDKFPGDTTIETMVCDQGVGTIIFVDSGDDDDDDD